MSGVEHNNHKISAQDHEFTELEILAAKTLHLIETEIDPVDFGVLEEWKARIEGMAGLSRIHDWEKFIDLTKVISLDEAEKEVVRSYSEEPGHSVSEFYFNSTCTNLRKLGLITIEVDGNKFQLSLTDKGIRVAERFKEIDAQNNKSFSP